MYCNSCSTQLPEGTKFCGFCGTNQNIQPYEVEFIQEDSLFKKIFTKIFIFLFMSGLLIMIILLLKYTMF